MVMSGSSENRDFDTRDVGTWKSAGKGSRSSFKGGANLMTELQHEVDLVGYLMVTAMLQWDLGPCKTTARRHVANLTLTGTVEVYVYESESTMNHEYVNAEHNVCRLVGRLQLLNSNAHDIKNEILYLCCSSDHTGLVFDNLDGNTSTNSADIGTHRFAVWSAGSPGEFWIQVSYDTTSQNSTRVGRTYTSILHAPFVYCCASANGYSNGNFCSVCT